ncbi:hypothetical protein [Nitrosomonas sp.]|uniref:hypothetical protein n=1 Tax=Nitrosomonas sp. TaxID=42353 RepID=UPI0025E25AE7|nr:hypothetical protein [Nitrosomonas sp.]
MTNVVVTNLAGLNLVTTKHPVNAVSVIYKEPEEISVTIGRVWRDAMQGERMSQGYGDDEQRRSVPARCDPSVTVIYERLLSCWSNRTAVISQRLLKKFYKKKSKSSAVLVMINESSIPDETGMLVY